MISRLEISAATLCVTVSVWVLLGRVVPLPIMLFVCVGLVLLPLLMSEDSHSSGSL